MQSSNAYSWMIFTDKGISICTNLLQLLKEWLPIKLTEGDNLICFKLMDFSNTWLSILSSFCDIKKLKTSTLPFSIANHAGVL